MSLPAPGARFAESRTGTVIGKPAAVNGSHSSSRSKPPSPPAPALPTLDVLGLVRRQGWLIAACTMLGLAGGIWYWGFAEIWHQSTARMLVTLKDPRLAEGGDSQWGESNVTDDILASHMQIVGSRRIVEAALSSANLMSLPSITARLGDGEDSVDYVIDHLLLTKGGEGAAKTARSLNIGLVHTDPTDARRVLEAIVVQYEAFLDRQVEQVMNEAGTLIIHAQQEVEHELAETQNTYLSLRRDAPLLYHGDGSSNVFMEKFKRLQDELVSVEIERSAVVTRLGKVQDAVAKYGLVPSPEHSFELMALIDTKSLERLGVFASLQLGTAATADFQASQPARLEEARTQFTHLLKLMADEQRVRSNFGPEHPDAVTLRQEIELVRSFLDERQSETAFSGSESRLTPDVLMKAYIGFLTNDVASLDERRNELQALAREAEKQSKELVEFELKDQMLRAEIERKQQLFDGVVEQLRKLDTASGLSGYSHEVLEAPRNGIPVWPSLPICCLCGLLLGGVFGAGTAVASDEGDPRFKSMHDLSAAIETPVIGAIHRLQSFRDNAGGSIVAPATVEAEAFRMLRTFLQADVARGDLKVLSVTSAQPKAGKSTVLANLAAVFADQGLSTLVLDADMRAPTVQKHLNVNMSPGLSEVLRGTLSVEEATQASSIPNLSVIAAGSPVANPSELLESARFEALLAELRTQYQLVLVDAGPVLLVSDPAVVSRYADATLLVVRLSTDGRRQVNEALRRLSMSGAKVRGCVANLMGASGYVSRSEEYGAGYGYGYGEGRYYGTRNT